MRSRLLACQLLASPKRLAPPEQARRAMVRQAEARPVAAPRTGAAAQLGAASRGTMPEPARASAVMRASLTCRPEGAPPDWAGRVETLAAQALLVLAAMRLVRTMGIARWG